jgi:uncharacterized protein (TIGR02996 family)
MNGVTMLLESLERDPSDDAAWLALADAVEEQGDSASAEITRLSLWLRRHPDGPEHAEHEGRLHELADQGVRVPLPRRRVRLSSTVDLQLVLVPPGTFRMGSGPGEKERGGDEEQHLVTLTKGFWIAIHPLTQAQWLTIRKRNPSEFKGDLHPVDCVSWEDCRTFCLRLNKHTKQTFRLPTEAEWEYACRAGTTTPFHFGATISEEIANYDATGVYGPGKKGSYRKASTPVCSYPDNPWGLFDVHGTIYEWCRDWYAHFSPEPAIDPLGPVEGGTHVLRGGSWFAYPNGCRSAYRNYGHPDRRDAIAGFRPAMDLEKRP